jgi:hypothetical protein
MRRTLWVLLATSAVVLVACNTSGSVTGGRSAIATTADEASIQRSRSSYEALAASGYHYRVTGRLSDVNVSSVGGKTFVTATARPGDAIVVSLEQIPSNIFSFGPDKSKAMLPVDCADCFDGGDAGSSPPRPQQTNPPNYDSCRAAGGATWFNEATGDGGCTGPGGSRGFPCGIWSYESPGHGHFRSWDGTLDAGDWTFISVNRDGNSCHLGY